MRLGEGDDPIVSADGQAMSHLEVRTSTVTDEDGTTVPGRKKWNRVTTWIDVEDQIRVADSLLADATSAAFAYPTGVASFGSQEMAVTICFPGELRANGRTAVASAAIAQNDRFRNSNGQIDLDSTLRFYSDDGFETRASLRECQSSSLDATVTTCR